MFFLFLLFINIIATTITTTTKKLEHMASFPLLSTTFYYLFVTIYMYISYSASSKRSLKSHKIDSKDFASRIKKKVSKNVHVYVVYAYMLLYVLYVCERSFFSFAKKINNIGRSPLVMYLCT